MKQFSDIHGLVPDHFQVICDLFRIFAKFALEVMGVYLLILDNDILVLREISNKLLVTVLEEISDDIQ